MGIFLHTISNTDEFTGNSYGSWTTTFQSPITVSPQSSISLLEVAFDSEFDSKEPEEECIIEVLDFLYVVDREQKLYGKWFKIKLEKIHFSSATLLCAYINRKIYKEVPRLRKMEANIFNYSTKHRRIWTRFPYPNMFVTILVKSYSLVLVGAEKHDGPRQTIVLGNNKPQFSYKFKNET